MPSTSYTPSSYYYGMPDMYMQMGYFPFPTSPAADTLNRHIATPYAMAMASQCRYYLGQTDKIPLGAAGYSYAALANPAGSGVQLYINEYVLTNFSAEPREAQIWFGATKSIVGAKTSTQVSPGYVQLSACPSAQGKILFASGSTDIPRQGVTVSTRILPAMTTVPSEKSGHWILDPGTAVMVLLPAHGESDSGEWLFAAGWWEQPVFG